MSKSFTDEQREHIRSTLIEKGRQLFSRFGLQKTSIDAITNATGISQGAFYLFFESKEALFYEIVTLDEADFKEALFKELVPHMDQPDKCIALLLERGLSFVDESPMLLQLLDPETMLRLTRKLSSARIESHFIEDTDAFAPLLSHWHSKGLIRPVDPILFSSVIRSLFLLCLHKKEIGADHFIESMSLLTELIGAGLINKEA